MKIKELMKGLRLIEKKYGNINVEVHHPFNCKDGTKLSIPEDLRFVAVATYPYDKENDCPEECVVVIK
jgi:hypothetical protein